MRMGRECGPNGMEWNEDRKSKIEKEGKIITESKDALGYVDDIAIITKGANLTKTTNRLKNIMTNPSHHAFNKKNCPRSRQ